MSFILRVRTSQGMHRLQFSTKQPSFGDLQSELRQKYLVEPESQVISKTPPNMPNFIESGTPGALLTTLGLKHGDIIYLILAGNQLQTYKASTQKLKSESSSPTSSSSTIESKMDIEDNNANNNNNNNSNSNAGSKRKKKFVLKPLKKSTSGARQVTLATSKWVNDPKNKVIDSGPKHRPFHEWIAERQKKYAERQPWLVDPPEYKYAAIPYRKNLKFSELPSNAVIKRQEYRHLDNVIFKDISPMTRFTTAWKQLGSQMQCCCYLIGKYGKIENTIKKANENINRSKAIQQKPRSPNKSPKNGKNQNKNTNNNNNSPAAAAKRYLMAASVYAIYEAPHEKQMRGVRFQPDPDEAQINVMIKACGMERIGWCITTMPRGDEKKYKGDIFMSGTEVYQAAQLQAKYANVNTKHSKFVTLITHVGNKEPQAFQISDQGVSMMRYGLIEPDIDPGYMRVKKPQKNEYVSSVINENSEIKPGETFLPDALLVNVISTKSKVDEHIFNYVHFPAAGSADSVRKHLQHHRTEPFHISLSDFYLLLYLPKLIDLTLAVTIAEHVVNKKAMTSELTNQVTQAFRRALPGWR